MWEAMLLLKVVYWCISVSTERIFFKRFQWSIDLLCLYDGCYGGRNENYTFKLIYTQLSLVGNVREDEKLRSSEVVYWSISFSTVTRNFSLAVSTYIMIYYADLVTIMMTGIKNIRPNKHATTFFLLEIYYKVISYALLKLCIVVSLSAQELINLLRLFMLL